MTVPIRAAPMAPPITEPLRSWAVVLVNHARAPAHATAPPTPCTNLEASSTRGSVPQPNPSVEAISTAMPTTVATLTPRRSTRAIDGMAASRTPAG